MNSDNVIVKNSPIQGKGVFASCKFKKGDVVLHWDISKVLSKDAVDKMSDKEKEYVSFLDNKYVMMQEPERYVNHSCASNTTAKNFCDIAIRDIKKGEEITGNYTKELPPNMHIKCNCGNKKCRKIIRS